MFPDIFSFLAYYETFASYKMMNREGTTVLGSFLISNFFPTFFAQSRKKTYETWVSSDNDESLSVAFSFT